MSVPRLDEMSRDELLALVRQLTQFGPVEEAVRAALVGVPSGGVGAARAALAISMAQLIDAPPDKAKPSELAATSKELRSVLKELDLERDGDSAFFDGLDDEADLSAADWDPAEA